MQSFAVNGFGKNGNQLRGMVKDLVKAALVLGLVAGGCTEESANRVEPVAPSRAPLDSTVTVSGRVELEAPLTLPGGASLLATATASSEHLLLYQRTSRDGAGLELRSFVLNDTGTVANAGGTAVLEDEGSLNVHTAVRAGTHWLAGDGASLLVLDADGALITRQTLPFSATRLTWGGDRALATGGSSALFVDPNGAPLGDPFVLPLAQANVEVLGAAFDGAHFLLDCSTLDQTSEQSAAGAWSLSSSLVAVAPDGATGAPVLLMDLPNVPTVATLGPGFVLPQGSGFFIAQSTPPAGCDAGSTCLERSWHYATASVDASHQLTLGAPQDVDVGQDPSVPYVWPHAGGYYAELSDAGFQPVAAFIGGDGSLALLDATDPLAAAKSALAPQPLAAVSGLADGSLSVACSSGRVTRLAEDGTALDVPALEPGTLPGAQRLLGNAFDGAGFSISWADAGHGGTRLARIDGSAEALAPWTLTPPVAAYELAANAQSLLVTTRDQDGALATATLWDHAGHSTSVDVSALSVHSTPTLSATTASDGSGYLLLSDFAAQTLASLIDASGSAVGEVEVAPGANAPAGARAFDSTAAFDGENFVVALAFAGSDNGDAFTDILATRVSPTLALVDDSPKRLYRCALGCYGALASNGNGTLLTWNEWSSSGGTVYAVRVAQDLGLLGEPVALGAARASSATKAVWDGSEYWAFWIDATAGATHVVGRRVGADGQLLDTDPVLIADDAYGGDFFPAASPSGEVVLAYDGFDYGEQARARTIHVSGGAGSSGAGGFAGSSATGGGAGTGVTAGSGGVVAAGGVAGTTGEVGGAAGDDTAGASAGGSGAGGTTASGGRGGSTGGTRAMSGGSGGTRAGTTGGTSEPGGAPDETGGTANAEGGMGGEPGAGGKRPGAGAAGMHGGADNAGRAGRAGASSSNGAAEKDGGCGCTVPSARTASTSPWLLALVFAAVTNRRRGKRTARRWQQAARGVRP